MRLKQSKQSWLVVWAARNVLWTLLGPMHLEGGFFSPFNRGVPILQPFQVQCTYRINVL